MALFGLKNGQDFENWEAHPTKTSLEYPSPPVLYIDNSNATQPFTGSVKQGSILLIFSQQIMYLQKLICFKLTWFCYKYLWWVLGLILWKIMTPSPDKMIPSKNKNESKIENVTGQFYILKTDSKTLYYRILKLKCSPSIYSTTKAIKRNMHC